MPIFDQGYQHWSGKLDPSGTRWFTIAREGLRTTARAGGARVLLLMSLVPALVLVAFLALWGLVEQGGQWADALGGLLRGFGVPLPFLDDPKAHRLTVWTFAFHIYLGIQSFFWVVIVMLTGPGLVSQDLRFNALPLYFSRPVGWWGYVLGKWGTIATFIGGVTLVPVWVGWGFGVAFSFDPTVARDTFPLLLGATGYCLLIMASAGALMLAISAASKNTVVVGLAWIMIWMLSAGASAALQGLLTRGDPELRKQALWTDLVSYNGNLYRMRQELLGTEAAWDDVYKMVPTQPPERPGFRFGARRRPPPQAISPLPPREELVPWPWAAGTLSGAFLLSGLVLAWRIRGMDRLR